MARGLTKKQKDFADGYLEHGNGSKAVKEANYAISTDESARSIASQNLTKSNILEYLESHAEIAAKEVMRIVQFGDSDQVRLSASKDVLDRAGYKPTEKSQNLYINVEISEEARKAAQDFDDYYIRQT